MGTLEKIKIIHVITRFDKGGSAENTFLTVQGLDKNRYEVILIRGISYESHTSASEIRAIESNLEEAKGKGVRIITIAELVRRIHPLTDLKAFLKLIKIFRGEKPHIVHTHTSKAGILGRWAACLTRVPVIIHTPHGHIFWGYFNHWNTALYIFLEKLTATITDKIITLTAQEKKDHCIYRLAHNNKFTIIHSGIDLNNFFNIQVNSAEVKNKLGIPEGSFVVGTIGRLTPVKGHKYLIEAASKILLKIPGMIFVFLGDGELINELKRQATVSGINDKVLFLGWRPDVAEIMSTFDVFVLPSLNEGMGKVLVEAMAMGKPIIASDIGGIPDLIIHGNNGLLTSAGDPESIAMSIEFLYRDPSKRKELGENGKAIAAQYSADSMIQKIDRLYLELFKKNCG